jgi:hypothetical protein
MRSVFVFFKEASRAEVSQFLNAHYANHGNEHWICSDGLFIGFYDDVEREFDALELTMLRSQLGKNDVLAISADISGSIDGLIEAKSFCELLLSHFPGFAMDDYSDHPWTLDEIRSDYRHGGHTFFDYLGWYEEMKQKRQ